MKPINKILKTINESDLIRHNLIFFIGSIAVALLNYIYYPIISRLVDVSEFGEIQAVIAVFMQVGILLTAFGYTVTFAVNNESQKGASAKAILSLERTTLWISLGLFILFCLSSFFLKNSLQFDSILPLLLVGLLIIINVPSTSRTYVLQGLKRLKEVSLSGIIFATSKLLLSVILLLLGFSVVGVMLAYIIAQLLTFAYLRLKTKDVFPGFVKSLGVRSKKIFFVEKQAVKTERMYGLVIVVLLFLSALLYSFDVVAVRFFVSPEQAGLYSGISTIAKIVYFVTVSVSGVLLVSVKLRDTRKKAHAVLLRSALIILGIGGLAVLVFSLFPSEIVRLFVGNSYVSMAHLLPLVSVLMLVCSFNNLLLCFHIARKNYRALWATGFSALLLVALLTLNHSGGVEDIVDGYLYANVLMLVIFIFQIILKDKR